MTKMNYQIEELYGKAIRYCLNLCSKKRYTEVKIRSKVSCYLIKQNEMEENKVSLNDLEKLENKAIDRLKELNYINDLDFAKDFIREKSRLQLKGRNKIVLELIKKNVSKEKIFKALDEVEIDEGILIDQALLKKKNVWTNLAKNKQKEKAYRFLVSRGFSLDSIYNHLNKYYSMDS